MRRFCPLRASGGILNTVELVETRKLFTLARGSYFWRDRTTLLLMSSSAVLLLSLFIISLTTFVASQEFVALHYTVFFGIDLVGERWNIFVFPAVGLVILSINTLLAWLCYKPVRFAHHLLLWGTVVALVILLFSLILIRFLVLPA